eukprot:TRINITY_DN9824_c0_g1_i1.p1 TRINITY_DN9824_c0_g1~~TRINITY_DN9824_c0_g1_i1.p1  ORF type:complete len:515 (+),score=174.90 TRINITY_DN9824_c0_g1_i1:63-1547(+)
MAGCVKACCTLSGRADLVDIDGILTTGQLADAVVRALGAGRETHDVVYVDSEGGETVLEGDAGLPETGIKGAEEVVEVRVSKQGAARGELMGRGVGAAAALQAFEEAVGAEEWQTARALAMSGWLAHAEEAEGGTALHILAALPAVTDRRAVPLDVLDDLVGLLVESGADINDVRQYAGRRAERAVPPAVRRRTDAASGPTTGTPLHAAAEWNNTAALGVLLKHGAAVDSEGKGRVTPCGVAAREGHADALTALIAAGADVNKGAEVGGATAPCHFAAEGGHAAALRVLVAAGADVNKAKVDGTTPCIIAALGGHVEVLRVLIEGGADVNIGDPYEGMTPCYFTCLVMEHETLRVLIEGGADVNKGDHLPIVAAAAHCDPVAVRMLIAAGADVNGVGKDGDTPCYAAARGGCAGSLRALIEAGADVNAVKKKDGKEDGTTPLWRAEKMRRTTYSGAGTHGEVVRVLVAAGAVVEGPPGGWWPSEQRRVKEKSAN